MEPLTTLVNRAQAGDLDAYGAIVHRFQDMAVGYAYSVLGDFHLAEDASQEAFLSAYLDLPKLRKPEVFPGWFRRTVFKYCDRLTRGKPGA
ncbi:MAG: sigma factor [bacterium]|nr:sigma factor [bacterium]